MTMLASNPLKFNTFITSSLLLVVLMGAHLAHAVTFDVQLEQRERGVYFAHIQNPHSDHIYRLTHFPEDSVYRCRAFYTNDNNALRVFDLEILESNADYYLYQKAAAVYLSANFLTPYIQKQERYLQLKLMPRTQTLARELGRNIVEADINLATISCVTSNFHSEANDNSDSANHNESLTADQLVTDSTKPANILLKNKPSEVLHKIDQLIITLETLLQQAQKEESLQLDSRAIEILQDSITSLKKSYVGIITLSLPDLSHFDDIYQILNSYFEDISLADFDDASKIMYDGTKVQKLVLKISALNIILNQLRANYPTITDQSTRASTVKHLKALTYSNVSSAEYLLENIENATLLGQHAFILEQLVAFNIDRIVDAILDSKSDSELLTVLLDARYELIGSLMESSQLISPNPKSIAKNVTVQTDYHLFKKQVAEKTKTYKQLYKQTLKVDLDLSSTMGFMEKARELIIDQYQFLNSSIIALVSQMDRSKLTESAKNRLRASKTLHPMLKEALHDPNADIDYGLPHEALKHDIPLYDYFIHRMRPKADNKIQKTMFNHMVSRGLPELLMLDMSNDELQQPIESSPANSKVVEADSTAAKKTSPTNSKKRQKKKKKKRKPKSRVHLQASVSDDDMDDTLTDDESTHIEQIIEAKVENGDSLNSEETSSDNDSDNNTSISTSSTSTSPMDDRLNDDAKQHILRYAERHHYTDSLSSLDTDSHSHSDKPHWVLKNILDREAGTRWSSFEAMCDHLGICMSKKTQRRGSHRTLRVAGSNQFLGVIVKPHGSDAHGKFNDYQTRLAAEVLEPYRHLLDNE